MDPTGVTTARQECVRGEMVDAPGSEPGDREVVWVQVPPGARKASCKTGPLTDHGVLVVKQQTRQVESLVTRKGRAGANPVKRTR